MPRSLRIACSPLVLDMIRDSSTAHSAEINVDPIPTLAGPALNWTRSDTTSARRIDLVLLDPGAAGINESVIAFYRGAATRMRVVRDRAEAQQRVSEALAALSARRTRLSRDRVLAASGYSASPAGLLHAVQAGAEQTVRLLVEFGVSPDTLDSRSIPVTHLAARGKHWEVLSALLAHHARHDSIAPDRGTSLVHEVAAAGHSALVAALLDAGAPIEHRSHMGQTALMNAIVAREKEAAALLVARGADLDAEDSLGMSPRSYARLYGLSELL